MLRRVRQKLRQIRYYSASRPQTAWTRAMDVAMIASFLLALPITWMCDVMVGRTVTGLGVAGQLLQNQDDSIHAVLYISDASPLADWKDATPIGNFHMAAEDVHRGWPLTTSLARPPAKLHIDLRSEVRPRSGAEFNSDDPVHVAIAAALQRDRQLDALEALTVRQGFGHQQRIAWMLAAGIWWIMLMFGSAMVIQVTKFLALLAQGKRLARRARFQAEGKCLACGYDMTGLEFNERCPECGELVW